MKNKSILLTFILAFLLAAAHRAPHAAEPLPRSTPEAQGISSQAIRDYVEAADKRSTRCTASCSCGMGM